MEGLDFIAIDFETATGKRASICEAGICVVKDGKVVETKSWLVRPEDNAYSYWNIQIHGIHPRKKNCAINCNLRQPNYCVELTILLRFLVQYMQ